MKKIGVIVLSILGCFLIFMGFQFYNTMKSSEAITFREIDFTSVENGTYEGSCEAGLVKVKTQVTIKDHQLSNIELLEHRNGLGTEAEVIYQLMMENNTNEIDSISGATVSSRVLRCALEQAIPNK